ncbi:MAG TPA: 2-isopropylmalate synthase [Candidatus Binatia bacterium]|nr:2-isopropylmalate synthase [Candidatus Binatia bacterium]
MKEHLIIFDTTLRDGEQSPGASMTQDEKVRIALALERLKVDVIEAGFAAASPGDFAAVQAVASQVRDSIVCSLARAKPEDLERAAEAIKPAPRRRIHTFIATSPIHMERKLRLAPDQVIEAAVAAVKFARRFTDDVEFSPEDAGRSEPDFLCRVLEQVIAAGATTVNVPDTVGYTLPHLFGALIGQLRERVPNSDKAVWSVHCHNDLGLAVANSLSAVLNGARQVECTINGLGERAGNAALEEIVMAVRTRKDEFPCDTRIDSTQIVHCSRMVSGVTGFPVQPNKAIVGANAFAHESGIHQDGVIKHRETYEIMRAEEVGWSTNKLVLGKHSGRAAFRQRLEQLGITLGSEIQLNQAFQRFKELADMKHEIYDDDLRAVVTEQVHTGGGERVRFVGLETAARTGTRPQARVSLALDGEAHEARGEGDGQVDAVFSAIECVVQSGAELLLFSVSSVSGGGDAQGEVLVRLRRDGQVVNGQGADTDIVVASAKAYVNAVNRLQAGPATRRHPQAVDTVGMP